MTLSLLLRRFLAASGVTAIVLVAAATPAAAHPGHEARLGGWLDGLLHPVSGFDHLVAMAAVGALAALTVRRLPVWSLPSAFLAGLVIGGGFGLAAWESGVVETVIAGSVLVLGVLVAASTRLPVGVWLVPAVAIAGFAHGNAHGLEAPTAAAPLPYVAGFVGATLALHAAGALAGLALRRFGVGRIAGGAAVAAFGATLLVA